MFAKAWTSENTLNSCGDISQSWLSGPSRRRSHHQLLKPKPELCSRQRSALLTQYQTMTKSWSKSSHADTVREKTLKQSCCSWPHCLGLFQRLNFQPNRVCQQKLQVGGYAAPRRLPPPPLKNFRLTIVWTTESNRDWHHFTNVTNSKSKGRANRRLKLHWGRGD